MLRMFCGISLNSLCKMHKIRTQKLSEKADFVRAQSFQIEITLCSCYNQRTESGRKKPVNTFIQGGTL